MSIPPLVNPIGSGGVFKNPSKFGQQCYVIEDLLQKGMNYILVP